MADDPSRLQAAVAVAEGELRAWRRAHPDATLTGIEQALDARLDAARAGLLAEVAGDSPAEEERCPACGERLARRGARTRTLRTSGDAPLELTRPYLSCPACGAGVPPLDERLGLLPGSPLTPWLVDGIVRLGAVMPFAQVSAVLAHFTGVTVSAATVRRLTEAAGAAQAATETAAVAALERALPKSPLGPPIQLLSVDGAMVPLVGGEWVEVKTLVTGTVAPPGAASHTGALSYVSRLADAETFGRLATGETHRRGTSTAGTVVAVTDGALWCQGFIDLHRPDAVRVLDFPHAIEHLGAAAQALFGPGTAAGSAWLGTQAHRLRHGGEATVLATLADLRVAPTLGADARAVVASAHAYLATRREHIRYQAFAAAGYPIGSGCVESANKLVVEARLKGAGMHWARRNVDPLLALRTLLANGRWDEAWPALWRGLRAARRRPSPRRAAPPPTPPSASAPPPALPPPIAPAHAPPAPRPKLVVNGTPTAAHPWKRALVAHRAIP